MTNWFDSTSLKNTSWPDSGHLIQRFSGTSRRARKLRIFGRTTLEIQFIQRLRIAERITARSFPPPPRGTGWRRGGSAGGGGAGGGGRHWLGASVSPPPLAPQLRCVARPPPPMGGRVKAAPQCST